VVIKSKPNFWIAGHADSMISTMIHPNVSTVRIDAA
jgi:hypothetical protein